MNWGHCILVACLASWIVLPTSNSASAQVPEPTTEVKLQAAGATQTTASRWQEMTVGNTFYYLLLRDTSPLKKGAVVGSYVPDSRTRLIRYPNGKVEEFTWWMEGDNYCTEIKTFYKGHTCFKVFEVQNAMYVCKQPEGDCFQQIRILPGNPENIRK